MRLGCGCCAHADVRRYRISIWCKDCGALAFNSFADDQQPLYFEKPKNGFRCALESLFDTKAYYEVLFNDPDFLDDTLGPCSR